MSTCAVNALKIAEARAIIILNWGSLSPSLMGSHPWLGDRLRFENRPSRQFYWVRMHECSDIKWNKQCFGITEGRQHHLRNLSELLCRH